MHGTLTIGDFAKATQLSVKTLRHYHDIGLLVPADIDHGSGYRRYDTDQIQVAQVIRRFRDVDMPLTQIGEVLATADPAERSHLIAAHLEHLEHELNATQTAVASLRRLLQGTSDSQPVTHHREPELQTAAIRESVDLAHLSPWFQGAVAEIHATLAVNRIEVSGPAGSVVSDEFFADEHGEITVFVPTAMTVPEVGRITNQFVPAAELAVIVHQGSHADIDTSYGALAAHVADRAIAVDGPIRERYLVGRHETSEESRWRTEIGWPIFQTTSN